MKAYKKPKSNPILFPSFTEQHSRNSCKYKNYLLNLALFSGIYRIIRYSTALAGAAREVEDHLHALEIGVFMAVWLENYFQHPIIGKVVEIRESTFTI